jgi:hypothetical protein
MGVPDLESAREESFASGVKSKPDGRFGLKESIDDGDKRTYPSSANGQILPLAEGDCCRLEPDAQVKDNAASFVCASGFKSRASAG